MPKAPLSTPERAPVAVLAVLLEIALLPLALGSWALALGFSLVNAILLAWRIKVEEATLGDRR